MPIDNEEFPYQATPKRPQKRGVKILAKLVGAILLLFLLFFMMNNIVKKEVISLIDEKNIPSQK